MFCSRPLSSKSVAVLRSMRADSSIAHVVIFDLAVGPRLRRAVGLPDLGQIARPRELERDALDGAVGGRAGLRERQRVARGDRLAAHAEREAARDHRRA